MKPAIVEVPARYATDDETPRPAVAVRKLAELAGWKVVPTYARARRGERLVESLALRMSHQERGQRAVAIWVNSAVPRKWRFDCGLRWGRDVYFGTVGANELKGWLRDA